MKTSLGTALSLYRLELRLALDTKRECLRIAKVENEIMNVLKEARVTDRSLTVTTCPGHILVGCAFSVLFYLFIY